MVKPIIGVDYTERFSEEIHAVIERYKDFMPMSTMYGQLYFFAKDIENRVFAGPTLGPIHQKLDTMGSKMSALLKDKNGVVKKYPG